MSISLHRHRGLALLVAAAIGGAGLAGSAAAQQADPAGQVVEALDSALLATMKAQGGEGPRAHIVAPAIDRAFDLPLMTRLSVGPAWASFTPAEQQGVISAFRAMTVAQYARNFEGWSGQRFAFAAPVETRGGDKLVRTQLISPSGDTEALGYRLRMSGGSWKIIDVYYRNAISQLATRRSDFAGVLAKGGARALIQHLNALAASGK